jgi:hypothetical protein
VSVGTRTSGSGVLQKTKVVITIDLSLALWNFESVGLGLLHRLLNSTQRFQDLFGDLSKISSRNKLGKVRCVLKVYERVPHEL